MEYTIVSGYQVTSVVAAVNELLRSGWELYGNLAVSATPAQDGDLHAQALIKRERVRKETEQEGSFGTITY